MNPPRIITAADRAARRNRPALAQQPLPEPSLLELAQNVTKAASSWAQAGFPVVDQPTYDARSTACNACDLWDPTARLGLGKCRAPGCGCTSLKRWLATEKCPLSQWPAAPLPAAGSPAS